MLRIQIVMTKLMNFKTFVIFFVISTNLSLEYQLGYKNLMEHCFKVTDRLSRKCVFHFGRILRDEVWCKKRKRSTTFETIKALALKNRKR